MKNQQMNPKAIEVSVGELAVGDTLDWFDGISDTSTVAAIESTMTQGAARRYAVTMEGGYSLPFVSADHTFYRVPPAKSCMDCGETSPVYLIRDGERRCFSCFYLGEDDNSGTLATARA